jgi:hypothetical protein
MRSSKEEVMSWRSARAGLLAALLAGVPVTAPAADLDYERRGEAEPYAPYHYNNEPRRYGGPHYDERVEPPRYSYRDEEPGYDDGRYSLPPRRYMRYDESACLDKREIRQRLKQHGWGEFHDLEIRPDVAVFSARRPDGLLYRLQVDRCTGVIVNARLLDDGRGWRQGARPYSQTY